MIATPRRIAKQLKVKDKAKILKLVREKQLIMYRKMTI